MGEDFVINSGLPYTIIRFVVHNRVVLQLQYIQRIWVDGLPLLSIYAHCVLISVTFCDTRPGRLTDGPYTSYDLNTLLKATAGERRAVLIGQGTLITPFSSNSIKLWL